MRAALVRSFTPVPHFSRGRQAGAEEPARATLADESVPRMPSTSMPDPALELARLDETRSLLAQLLQLATRREAALTAQTEGLRVPPRASDAGDSSSLLLSSAMEDQPNFLASSSLLGPPPGTQVLEARTEEKFQRLAQAQAHAHTCTHHAHTAHTHPSPPVQLDEAIAHLEVLAAAAPSGGGSSSAGPPCAEGARRPRLGLALRQFRELSGADSELAAGLHSAAHAPGGWRWSVRPARSAAR